MGMNPAAGVPDNVSSAPLFGGDVRGIPPTCAHDRARQL